jgi:hypothetical protein
MRSSSPGSAGAIVRSQTEGTPARRARATGRTRAPGILVRCLALAGLSAAMIAVSATSAMALTVSHNVALIPSNQPSPPEGIPARGYPDGILPVSTTVAGNPNESFDKFSFTNVAVSQITSAELSHFDTVVLNEVKTRTLTHAAQSALAQFVAAGGKLLIHDADLTSTNVYSWLSGGSGTTQVGAGCNDCGKTSGTSTIVANSPLISANPTDPSYVNLGDMGTFTDAVGDSNLLTSTQRWVAAVRGTNANGEQGAQLAYATMGRGIAVYNGFDTDMIMPTATSPWRCVNSPQTQYFCPAGATHEQVDWLAQMWYNELELGAVPTSSGQGPTQVSSIGTPVPPSQAGLPPAKSCLAKHKLYIRLTKLVRHHRKIVRIDVYVNGHRRVREQLRHVRVRVNGHRRLVWRGHWHNVTLRRLPRHSIRVKIVATTSRRYHLISKARYTAC